MTETRTELRNKTHERSWQEMNRHEQTMKEDLKENERTLLKRMSRQWMENKGCTGHWIGCKGLLDNEKDHNLKQYRKLHNDWTTFEGQWHGQWIKKEKQRIRKDMKEHEKIKSSMKGHDKERNMNRFIGTSRVGAHLHAGYSNKSKQLFVRTIPAVDCVSNTPPP